MLSIVIPANNEAGRIGPCLDALLAQSLDGRAVEAIVVANACTDATTQEASARAEGFARRGWSLTVLDLAEGGKPNALNRGDAAARFACRVYLDADVICSPDLLARMSEALDTPEPRYATGRLVVAPAHSWITRRYGALWKRLPFVTGGATGAGLFAVNAAGRARWGVFPEIISDDTYVRLLFRPDERIEVDAPYVWPLVEGYWNLVRVRRRQDAGVEEVLRKWPELAAHDADGALNLGRLVVLLATLPVSFCVYVAVRLAAKSLPAAADAPSWARGR